MDKMPVTKRQFLLIGLLVLSFFLIMDLNSRLSDLFRLSNLRDDMVTQVAGLQGTENALKTNIAYATSQAGVEDWARLQKMGMSGDNPVIPLAEPGLIQQPAETPIPTPRVVQHWERWWAIFFDK